MNPIDLHSGYTWWWVAIGIQIILVEAIAVFRPEGGDTLTEHVRWAMFEHPVITGIIAFFLLWLFYHFIVETHT